MTKIVSLLALTFVVAACNSKGPGETKLESEDSAEETLKDPVIPESPGGVDPASVIPVKES